MGVRVKVKVMGLDYGFGLWVKGYALRVMGYGLGVRVMNKGSVSGQR